MIRKYRSAWSVNNVILVGYSFGADVLPASFLALPESERKHVRLVSLLGLSTRADWQITVDGWLGSHRSDATPTLPAAQKMPMALIQCVNGAYADNAACTALGKSGADVFVTKGGHHFGGEYGRVEQAILAAYADRTTADVRRNLTPLGNAQISHIQEVASTPLGTAYRTPIIFLHPTR